MNFCKSSVNEVRAIEKLFVGCGVEVRLIKLIDFFGAKNILEVRHAVKEDTVSSDDELQEQEIQAVDDIWSQQVEEEMAAEAGQDEVTALDNAKLCKMREAQIQEVCEILQLDVQTVQSLLTYTQWVCIVARLKYRC